MRQLHSRRLLVLMLGVVVAGLGLLIPARPVLAGPPSGWVKADVVSGGCDGNGNCNSEVTPGSPTLYEYRPDRRSYRQGVGPGPEHGGYRTAERRDYCTNGGVNYGLAAGSWHHGARWVLTYVQRNGVWYEHWSKKSGSDHWAFYHTDNCDFSVPPVSPTAGGGGTDPTPTAAPGGGGDTPATPTLECPGLDCEYHPPTKTPTWVPTDVPNDPCVNLPDESFPLWTPDGLSASEPGPLLPPDTALRFRIVNNGNYKDDGQTEGADRWNEASWKLIRRETNSTIASAVFHTEIVNPSIHNFKARAADIAGATVAPAAWNLREVPIGSAVESTATPGAPLEPGYYAIKAATRNQNCRSHIAFYYFRVGSPPNVSLRKTGPVITLVGEMLTYRLSYANTTTSEASGVTIADDLPAGVSFLGANPRPSQVSGRHLVWTIGTLAGEGDAAGRPSRGEIRLTVRVTKQAPSTLINQATIAAPGDADPSDNHAAAQTAVLVVPAPEADFRIFIHSRLDPRHGVYRSTGAAITWLAGETLDFAPAITLNPPAQPPSGLYHITQRVAAWSFVANDNQPADKPRCRPRAEPTAADLRNADLDELEGCVYRYYADPGPPEMAQMAHAYWSNNLPPMPETIYGYNPLPDGPTYLDLAIAVVSEVTETGTDLDGDGNRYGLIYTETTVEEGRFRVTLLVPRSAR